MFHTSHVIPKITNYRRERTLSSFIPRITWGVSSSNSNMISRVGIVAVSVRLNLERLFFLERNRWLYGIRMLDKSSLSHVVRTSLPMISLCIWTTAVVTTKFRRSQRPNQLFKTVDNPQAIDAATRATTQPQPFQGPEWTKRIHHRH